MRPIIFPCLTSIIAAYLFNPLIIKLEQYKISRLYSAILIILVLLIILILAITFVLPTIYLQIISILNFLVDKLPSLKTIVIVPIIEFINMREGLFDNLSKNFAENYSSYLSYFVDALKIIINFMIQMLSSSFSLVYIISLTVITPVIFFYVLRDLPLIIEKINDLIPIPYRKKVLDYFSRVDFIISNYLKGQVNVCIAMTIFYSIGLSILNLKNAITVGIMSGGLTFIPYVGPLLYSIIGFFSALTQFNDWFQSIAVLLLFLIGQLIDSNILVPLLIGRKIHIHPVIVILGITVCASYFGFIGILLFIPIVAIFKVSVECAIDMYQNSEFYKKG